MSEQELEQPDLPSGIVQYKVETRTITLAPHVATALELDLRLKSIELQVEDLIENRITRGRLVTMVLSGVAAILFAGLSVYASMRGNESLSLSLLTPGFIGSVSAVTLAFLVSRD